MDEFLSTTSLRLELTGHLTLIREDLHIFIYCKLVTKSHEHPQSYPEREKFKSWEINSQERVI